MAIPAWFWPGSGQSARAVSLAPFSTRIVVPDWLTPRYFPFDPTIPGLTAPIVMATGTPGVSAVAPDGSGGLWLIGYNGGTWRRPSVGGIVSGALASGHVYNGAAFMAGSGLAMSSDGNIWSASGVGGGGGTLFGSWPVAANSLIFSGATLAALLPSSGLIGTMTVPGAVTGSIALPASIAVPSCIAMAAGSGIIAGGWQNAAALSGAVDSVVDPTDATTMLAIGSGRALTWRTTTGAMTENWTQSQLLTGLANLTNMAWRPDGTQILAPSVSSGTVQVIGYSAGLLSLLQSVTVSGAFSIAVNADSTHALVSRSGQSSAMPLTFGGGTWTTGAAVTGLPGITSLASFGDTGVAAAVSGGISFLGLVAGVWNILSTTALGFTPNQVTVDPFLNVYAAGSGALSVLTSGGTVIGSGAWAGAAPTAMAVQNGRVVLAIPSDGLIRLFGQSDTNAWVQKGTAVLAMGTPVGLGLSNTVLFVNGSGSTLTYSFSGAPYTLNRVTSGMASRWNGAAWTDTPLGIGHNPSALNYDASGNAVVVTHQDTLWTIGSGGVVLSSGALTVFPGQLQTTPIGASAVLTASGRTYVGSSLAGVLTEVA